MSMETFCRFCEIVVLNKEEMVKKKVSELPFKSQEDELEDEVTFCSAKCFMQYSLSENLAIDKEMFLEPILINHQPSKEDSAQGELMSKATPMDSLPPMSPFMEEDGLSAGKLTPGRRASTASLDDEAVLAVPTSSYELCQRKRWQGVRYKKWTPSIFDISNPKEDENEQENDALFEKNLVAVKPSTLPPDARQCLLCHSVGDKKADGPGRLLNMDVNKWVHLNCALWSTEVYETVNGALVNVDVALKRCVSIICVKCHKNGASLKCFKQRCLNCYHLACAMDEKAMFFKDKTLFCSQHVPKSPNPDAAMNSFIVNRRVYINRDEHKQLAAMIHLGESNVMRIGSMILMNIGQLLPHQLNAFHTSNAIYPVGFKIVRFYWSYRNFGKRCKYICSIEDKDGRPEFVVDVEEEGEETVTLRSFSPRELWQKIIEPISIARRDNDKIKVFSDCISGEDLFGLSEISMVRILESLPGIDTVHDYNFRYGRSQFLELPLAINPSGAARCEPKLRTHFKRSTHALHTSNPSKSSLQSSFSGAIEIQSPYVKQFVHSKSVQYRKMKTDWRNNVFLARSRIAGLGLYAAKDIEKHTMVIEYIGQLIRNEIAERNELLYTQTVRTVIDLKTYYNMSFFPS